MASLFDPYQGSADFPFDPHPLITALLGLGGFNKIVVPPGDNNPNAPAPAPAPPTHAPNLTGVPGGPGVDVIPLPAQGHGLDPGDGSLGENWNLGWGTAPPYTYPQSHAPYSPPGPVGGPPRPPDRGTYPAPPSPVGGPPRPPDRGTYGGTQAVTNVLYNWLIRQRQIARNNLLHHGF